MKIDEYGKDFDEIAKCWKLNSEKSCRRELILATIKEVVEAAEKELVPAGFKTINVGELGLSFPSVNTPHTADEVRDGSQVGVAVIIRASHLCGPGIESWTRMWA